MVNDNDNSGVPDLGALMSNMAEMQQNIAKARDELASETMQISTGGGAVTVVITGHQRVNEIRFDTDKIDMSDTEKLQELTVKAVNQAIEMSQQMAAQRMQGLMGGMDLPGLTG